MNLASWSRRHLERYGDFPALVVGDREWTNRALHDDASKLASALIALGVRPGDRILLVLPSGREVLVAATAAWLAGAVIVAPHLDAPPAEIERIIAHCTPSAAITAVPLPLDRSVTIRTAGSPLPSDSPLLDDLIAQHAPLEEPVPRAPDDPAQLTYTSGSTGLPKATIYTHGGLNAMLEVLAERTLAGGDLDQVVLVTLSPTAFGGVTLRARWTVRAKLIMLPRFDPREVFAAIKRFGITHLPLVPSLAEGLLAIADPDAPPPSVRDIRIGGAHTSPELARAVERYFGVRPINTYGMTEAGGLIASDEYGSKPGSVGRAAPGVEIKIVDSDGRPEPAGREGEIYVRAPWKAAGYWGTTPDASVFQPDGWIRTGDRGRLDEDGALYLSGRSKDVIIMGGHNVVPVEVHDVVREVPGVAECAIIGVPDPFLGEMVVAWVVRRPGSAVTEEDVLAHCRRSLDPRKWPGRVCFADELPRMSTGKLKLDELRQRTAASLATETELVKQLRREPPDRRAALLRSVIARELAAILGAEPADPSATFGSSGLSSLGAVQLAGKLGALLGRTVAVTLLFRHPTIEALARALDTSFGRSTQQRAARRIASDDDPIAIVGAACRLPGGVTSPDKFWELLRSGRDAVGEPPDGRWRIDEIYDPVRPKPGKTYVRTASFVEGADKFDAAFFGLTAEAELIDPQHRMLLEVSWEALEHAGYDPRGVPGRVGMMVGISSSSYPPRSTLGVVRGMALGRVCHFLDLRGPAQSVDTTCSSSLVALHDAVRALRLGECDTALVGGVSMMWSPTPLIELSQLELLAADGRSKAFDASGDGFGQGEGCVVLVLERLSEAQARGDRVLAIVRGSAVNHDGHSSSLTAPNPVAQEDVIRSALEVANLSPDAVQCVEAHGTGTVLGDPIEVEALTQVFGERRGAPLAIGSVKTNIGHLEAAAGLAGVLKLILALKHRQLPPSLHFKTPNPHIPWESIPIRVQRELGPWPMPDAPLIAGVSSFGLSGTNAHVILEEAPHVEPTTTALADGGELLALPVSARTPDALRSAAARLATALDSGVGSRADVAYTAACRRPHHVHRLVVHGASTQDWARQLRGYARGEHSDTVVHGRARRGSEPRVAFAFGGQGSQWHAMGRELLATEPVFRSAVEQVAALVEPRVSWKLIEELSRDEATSRIDDTEIAQPVLFALQVGLVALLSAWGVEPSAVIGHSLGEITAAYIAGALTLEQAVQLVVVRGTVLQRATGKGRMAVVTLAAGRTEELLADVPGIEIAASNAPRSTTISGPADAIDRALVVLAAAGIDAKPLKVNYAFHHAMLAPLAAELTAALGTFEPAAPRIAMISTVTGGKAPRLDAGYWGEQVRRRVRFEEATRVLLEDGYDVVVEIGAHPVLTPAIEQVVEESGRDTLVVASLRRKYSDRAAILEAVGALYCSGYPIQWTRQSPSGRVVELPTYPWEHTSYRLDDPLLPVTVTDANATSTPEPLNRLFHTITWKEVARTSAAVRDARYLIFADEDGVAASLRPFLEADGAEVVVVPNDRCAPKELAHLLAKLPSAPTNILYLWGLDTAPPDATTSETLERDHHRTCVALLHLTQAIVQRGWDQSPRLFVLTRGAQPVRSNVLNFAQSALWGMGAGLVHELPELDVTLIDLDPHDLDPRRLHDELVNADREDRIALRGSARLAPRLVRSSPPASTWTAAPDQTYLITGGLGGLGLVIARRLVDRGARQLALVGRSSPRPDAERTVDELRAAGANIQIVRADAANARELEAALAQLRTTMPPLAGVVHAAGVADSGVLVNLDAQRMWNVMAAKVLGGWNLHRLTLDQPIQDFVMFGSVAGLLGFTGEVHYAAANAFLDGLVHYRRSRGLPAQAIDWGAWADVGMGRGVTDGSAFGAPLLSVAEGADAFERLLANRGTAQTVVMELDARRWRQAHPRSASMKLLSDLEHSDLVQHRGRSAVQQELHAARPEARAQVIDAYLLRAVMSLLDDPPARIARDTALRDLGLDSQRMIGLKNLIERELGVTVSAAVLYGQPSVAKLATWCMNKLFADSTTAPAHSPPKEVPRMPSAPTPVPSAPAATNTDIVRQLEDRLAMLRKRGL